MPGAPENTGKLVYTLLIQINNRTGLPTGLVKPNVPSDPDYIPPVIDKNACPIRGNKEFSDEFSTEFN